MFMSRLVTLKYVLKYLLFVYKLAILPLVLHHILLRVITTIGSLMSPVGRIYDSFKCVIFDFRYKRFNGYQIYIHIEY